MIWLLVACAAPAGVVTGVALGNLASSCPVRWQDVMPRFDQERF